MEAALQAELKALWVEVDRFTIKVSALLAEKSARHMAAEKDCQTGKLVTRAKLARGVLVQGPGEWWQESTE